MLVDLTVAMVGVVKFSEVAMITVDVAEAIVGDN